MIEVELKNKLQLSNQVRAYENDSLRNTKTGASKLILSKLFFKDSLTHLL